MARKSRRHITDIPVTTLPIERVYKTAVYARLSVEDSGKKDGGDSIENQVYLIKQFIEERPFLKLCAVYCDNGETGVNFDRPEWNKMMNDIKAGKIDCIVVKDLSRFGRNYIETGNYLEKIFPFLGVRFLSINDNYDTNNPDRSSDSLAISLKSLINDVYAKDISRKVTAALETKQRNGEFIGNFAPYGYMKSPDDKHKIIIDTEVAEIVRDIFSWKLDGMGNNAIARKLNDMGIISPNMYRYTKGLLKNKQYADTLWLNRTVKGILENPTYTGCMSQGKKKTRLMQGLGPKRTTPDEWVIVENTHEPIIDKAVFDAVQDILSGIRNSYHEKAGKYAHIGNPENIFKGLLRCADCGVNLSRYKKVKPNKHYFFHVCPNYERNQTRICKCRKSANEEVLIETVFNAVKAEIDLCVDTIALVNKVQKNSKSTTRVKTIKEKTSETKKRIDRLDVLLSSLYNDYSDGILNESEYLFAKAKYLEEKRLFQLRLDELLLESAKHSEAFLSDNKWVAAMSKFKCEKQLNKDMLRELVDHIDISENNKASVVFKYRDEYEALLHFIAESGVNESA